MINTGDSRVYAYVKRYENQNGLVVLNLSDQVKTVTLNVRDALSFTGGVQDNATYYLNNLFNNTYQTVNGSSLSALQVTLEPYGSIVYTVSLTRDTILVPPIVSVDDDGRSEILRDYELYQNYPNPFNPETTIEFSLRERGSVKLTVYDALGREIKTIVNGELPAGNHKVKFYADGLPSGVYFYRLSVNGFERTRKMILVK